MERTFGEILKELREKRGLKVNQLAMYSNVSPALISRIENGKRGTPKPDTIKKLAKGLKMEYSELMALAGFSPEDDERDPVDKLIEYLDLELTDEEIMERFTFKVDDIELTDEEVKEFINFVRGKRYARIGENFSKKQEL